MYVFVLHILSETLCRFSMQFSICKWINWQINVLKKRIQFHEVLPFLLLSKCLHFIRPLNCLLMHYIVCYHCSLTLLPDRWGTRVRWPSRPPARSSSCCRTWTTPTPSKGRWQHTTSCATSTTSSAMAGWRFVKKRCPNRRGGRTTELLLPSIPLTKWYKDELNGNIRDEGAPQGNCALLRIVTLKCFF